MTEPKTKWNTTFYDPADALPKTEESPEQRIYTAMRHGICGRKALSDMLWLSQDQVGRSQRRLAALDYVKLTGNIGRQRFEVINPNKWKVKL